MNAKELLNTRRSTRKFTNEVISKGLLHEVMELTSRAPSWKNYQIARFNIIQDKNIINQISKQGVNDFVYNMKAIANANNLCVLSYIKGLSGTTDGKYDTSKKTWEVFDAGIAAHQFCLALHSVGLGSVIMGIIDVDMISSLIELPENEEVAAVIVFGVPNEEVKFRSRKSIDEIVRYK